jgi:hypothetical protein
MADKKIASDTPAHAASAAESLVPDLPGLQVGTVETALTQALPVPDIMFGGTVLIFVVMYHAFWIRLITNSFLKRSQRIGTVAALWRADLLFAAMVMALLALHLGEVIVWSAALILGGIVTDWSRAAYFAANCYTALGEPFKLANEWRIVPPIIAISGIFTFAWTASVLVNFVARYNDLRADILARRERHPADKTRAS